MGLSSRPDYHFDSYETVIAYFVESIEAWRVAKNISTLTLVGHSFGGYMAFHYSLKYPNRVSSLILASTMGGTTRSAEEVAEGAKKIQDSGFFKK
jgi:cardiolipin-specific phospholipase